MDWLKKIKDFILSNIKFIITVIVILFVCTFELPYVVYKPGGLVNLNDRIIIDNDNIKGSLSMCYVSLMKGTLPVLGLSYLFPNWDIIPKEDITIDDESVDDLLELDRLYLQESIDNATILAYQKAGKEINITKEINNVIYITDEADTDIKVYDKILSVEGEDISSLEDLKEIVSRKKENDTINILVDRNGKKINTTSKIYKLDDSLKVGISTLTTYEYTTDPEIKVKTKASEAGSSGGLMLSLAIYNKLTPEDITKGKKIVGTGTIDINGNVGEIDGVKYKLLGAEKNKAYVFLCPMENYDEALKVKKDNKLDIIIKAVSTFDEALTYLTNLE